MKNLLTIVFCAILMSTQVNAESITRNSVLEVFGDVEAELESLVKKQNRKYEKLKMNRLTLPQEEAVKQNYKCKGSISAQTFSRNASGGPLTIVDELSFPIDIEYIYESDKIEVTLSVRHDNHSFKVTAAANLLDGSTSIDYPDLETGQNKTMDLGKDWAEKISPQLAEALKQAVKQKNELGNEIVVGKRRESQDIESLVGALTTISDFKNVDISILSNQTETISIGLFKPNWKTNVPAFNETSSLKLSFSAPMGTATMAIASNELKNVITGAILDSVNIEYVEGGKNGGLRLMSKKITRQTCRPVT